MQKKNLWFKRRRYGWGWTPVVWQGWLNVVVYLFILIPSNLYFMNGSKKGILIFLGILILATLILLLVSFWKGPTPKWRFGKREDDDPNEDF